MIEREFNFDIEKLTKAINSGTIELPPGLTGEERKAFIRNRLKELDIEVPQLRPKHDPEGCLALARKYIEGFKLELNNAE